MTGYNHPGWWTDELDREAVRLVGRHDHLARCGTCGIVMRCDAQRCGEDEDGHQQ